MPVCSNKLVKPTRPILTLNKALHTIPLKLRLSAIVMVTPPLVKYVVPLSLSPPARFVYYMIQAFIIQPRAHTYPDRQCEQQLFHWLCCSVPSQLCNQIWSSRVCPCTRIRTNETWQSRHQLPRPPLSHRPHRSSFI